MLTTNSGTAVAEWPPGYSTATSPLGDGSCMQNSGSVWIRINLPAYAKPSGIQATTAWLTVLLKGKSSRQSRWTSNLLNGANTLEPWWCCFHFPGRRASTGSSWKEPKAGMVMVMRRGERVLGAKCLAVVFLLALTTVLIKTLRKSIVLICETPTH